ncbi:MAG: MFS transporter [Streptosporangiales bacterium]
MDRGPSEGASRPETPTPAGRPRGPRVLRSYTGLLADPAVHGFVAFGLVGRMSISMLSLGVVLLVSALRDSYALAGLVAAALVLGEAIGAPLVGRLADRYGQARVLAADVPVHSLALVALLLACLHGQPSWQLVVAAALAGAAFPPVGSFVRTRWSHRLGGTPRLHTAYAFESVLDELIFVVGPVAVTVLATEVHPAAGILAALAATIVGGIGFARQRGTEPGPQPRTREARFVLRNPTVLVVTLATCVTGAALGSIDVATVAFTSAEGARWAAGPVLAVLAVGSGAGGLTFGAVHWRSDPALRYALLSTALGVLLLPLAFVSSLGLLFPLGLLSGVAIAPVIVAGNTLVELRAPRPALTEALTWVQTGLLGGVALGSWLAGQAVDILGGHHGYVVPSAMALASTGVCWLGWLVLRRAGSRSAVDG